MYPSSLCSTSKHSKTALHQPQKSIDAWHAGRRHSSVSYRQGQVLIHRGRSYRCRQSHTAYGDQSWAPRIAHGLWAPHSKPAVTQKQPASSRSAEEAPAKALVPHEQEAVSASADWLRLLRSKAEQKSVKLQVITKPLNANFRCEIGFGRRVIKGPPRLTREHAERSAAKLAVEETRADDTPDEYQYTGHKIVVMPKSDKHEYTIVLLHGLDDSGCYWLDLEPDLHDVMAKCGVPQQSIKIVCVNAPWRGDSGAAWFEYLTDRSGRDAEDQIDIAQLEQTRRELHKLIDDEVHVQQPRVPTVRQLVRQVATLGGDCKRLLLAGSSQGALPVVVWHSTPLLLTQRRWVVLYVCEVLGLLLGATPVEQMQPALPVMVVSGGNDRVFVLSLVKRTLERLNDEIDVQHHVIKRMTHSSESVSELEKLVLFMANCFHLDD